MSFDRRQKTLRKPRYRFVETGEVQAEIERAAGHLPMRVRVGLRDLSRTGYQFKTPLPLEPQETVILRLWTDDLGKVDLQGTVRWMQPVQDGTWLVGCLTDSALEWHLLGELFLNGILSPEAPE